MTDRWRIVRARERGELRSREPLGSPSHGPHMLHLYAHSVRSNAHRRTPRTRVVGAVATRVERRRDLLPYSTYVGGSL